MSKNSKLGYFYLVLGIFTWSTIELTISEIHEESSPITINFLRFLIGGLVLLFYSLILGKNKSLKLFVKAAPKYYIPASILGLVIGMLLFTYGTTLTTSSLAATIFSSNPIIIAFFIMFKKGETKNATKIIGIVLGFFGVFVIISELNFHDFTNSDYLLGNILVFLGMILWCVDILIGKEIINNPNLFKKRKNVKSPDEINEVMQIDDLIIIGNIEFNSITFLCAALCYLPLLFIPQEMMTLQRLSVKAWLGIIYLGVVTAGIGYILFFKGLKMVDASKGINIFYLKPIFATLLAYLINGGDQLSNYLFIGIIIEIIALFLITKE